MKALVFAALAIFCTAAPAQQKRPMTFADLQAIKRISDPQISPSGKWVLFSVTDVVLEKNSKTNHLWAVPLGPTEKAGKEAQLTQGDGESNGRFSPDGKSVMYTSGDQLQVAPWNDATGTLGAPHAVTTLRTGADGGLWAPDSQHFLFTSSVYPDCESHAASSAQRATEEANCNTLKETVAANSQVKALVFDHLLYRHWTSFQGAKHSHVFYGSLDGSAPTDLTPASVIGDHEAPTFSLGGPLGYAISPDGKEVAYVTNLDKVPAASTNNDIFTLQLGAEPSTAKKVSTSPGSDDGPQYSPDGKWLAWRSQARNGFESDKFRLIVIDRSKHGVKNVLPLFDGWVDEFIWAPDSEKLFFASGNHGEEQIFIVHPNESTTDVLWSEAKDDEKRQQNAEYGGLTITPSGQALVTTKMSINSPPKLVAMQVDKAKKAGARLSYADNGSLILQYGVLPRSEDLDAFLTPEIDLTSINSGLLDELGLDGMSSFWFTGAANTKVQGFLLKPPHFDPSKKYPVKFLMHGGPQTAWGDAWSYRWNWQLMAAGGYVVVGINRRGSTGYGQKFVDEVSGDWGGKAYIDLMRGLDYAETKFPFIDKTRECALGASYGGFMANWVLTHTDRFKCIVTHDGMYNPQSAYGTTEEMWFNEWEFRPTTNPGAPSSARNDASRSVAKVGPHNAGAGMVEQTKPAQPWDFVNATNDADPFRKFSPMLHIKNAHTPTLVIHSQRDYRLDVSEGFQLFTALQRLGVPSRMLYFPDEGHWVLKPQNSQLWYETVNDWCDRWLGMNKYADTGPETNPMAAKPLTAPVQLKSGQKGASARPTDR